MSASMAEEINLALGSFSVREDRVTLAAHVAEQLAANGYGKLEPCTRRHYYADCPSKDKQGRLCILTRHAGQHQFDVNMRPEWYPRKR